jgi:RNA polymerase sigma-70 factor (ECF subfamily)
MGSIGDVAEDELAGIAFAEGVERWPGVHVDRERFAAFFAERRGSDTANVDGAGLYLACACLAGDAAAARAFRDHFMPDIDIALARLGYAGARADDLRSAVLEKLFSADPPKIGSYRGTGPLGMWVRAVTANEAMSHGRTRARRDALLDAAQTEIAPADVELSYLKEHYRDAFREAFGKAIASLDAPQRAMLRHRFVDALTLDQLAAACGVHRATAARHLAMIRQQLLDTTRAELQVRLRVDRSEFESIIRLIQSNFDVSVQKILNNFG